LAAQQRAKTEIEAALTIASSRPRDQKAALDRIITTCQRMGVASNSQYQYARGGTNISGPNIRLLEVIAQNWGNIEWGFRELARFPAVNGLPGESVVEAVAWDLETNSKVRKEFTVSHSERTKKGLKVFTDPRDIYEWIANQAQRRVRTCLENVIPRDVQDAACEQCDETMKVNLKIGPDTIKQLLERFAGIGVNKEQLEARIQRRIDTISPAQIIGLGKVYASVRDGLARAEDFFDFAPKEPEESAVDKAKAALRKGSKATPSPAPEQTTEAPAPAPQEPAAEQQPAPAPEPAKEPAPQAGDFNEPGGLMDQYRDVIAQADTLEALTVLTEKATKEAFTPEQLARVNGWIGLQKSVLRQKSQKSRKGSDAGRLSPTQPEGRDGHF
jgi:hypothetical protein